MKVAYPTTATGSLLLAVSVTATAIPVAPTRNLDESFINVYDTVRFTDDAPLVKSQYSVSLRRTRHGHSRGELDGRSTIPQSNYTTDATKRYGGLDYSMPIQWGNQTFEVEIDSGSSDLWIAHTNFTCYDVRGQKTYRSFCGFGELYNGGFKKELTHENFNITYGTGHVQGHVGYEDITVANLTVTDQEVGIAYSGYWDGDNKTAGLMGLAYPSITNAWYGTDYKNDNAAHFQEYDPFFFSAFKRRLIPPVWSLALMRGADNEYAGQLAFGGLPDVDFDEKFVSKPIKVIRGEQDGKNKNLYDFYAIEIDGWVLNGQYFPEEEDYKVYVVDSGTDTNDISPSIAAKINAKFNPPAHNDKASNQYIISCNATAPEVSVRIGGMDFPIDAQDEILPAEAGTYQRATGYCVTGVQVGGSHGNNILGDPFLKNVVAVFDVGAAEMRFAKHTY